MPTAACGLNCDVCRLMVSGICSTCGPGDSADGARKMAAQERILGTPCPVLACAVMNKIAYCPRDCRQFPCENFSAGPYPYSNGFIEMQSRRRQEKPAVKTPAGAVVTIPPAYWPDLAAMDTADVCARCLVHPGQTGGYVLTFLDRDIWMDVDDRSLKKKTDGPWETIDDPLLELVLLLYLQHASRVPLRYEMVTVNELKESHFFAGIHALDVDGVARRFGDDPAGFEKTARTLGGTSKDYADRAYTFMPLPKVPVTYLLWLGDDEFPPRVTVCFDRSIEQHFAADGIWALVKRITFEMVTQT
jgi:hypothetical protein